MSREVLSDFGGVVSTLTPNLLELGEAERAEFCDVIDGVIETTLGRRLATTLSGVVTTIYDWRRLDGSNIVIVFTTTEIYKVTFTFAGASAVSIKGAYTITGTRAWSITYATIADKLIMTNGSSAPIEWDGVAASVSTLTLPTGVTVPQFVLWWKSRLHLFNVVQDGAFKPFRHWWSQPFSYNTWNTTQGAGLLDYTRGGEPFTGVADLENLILIFKQNRVVLVQHTGSFVSPFTNRELDHVRGTYSPFSIQATPIGVFYLAVDGLRLFNGTDSTLVSDHVDAFSAIPATALASATSVLDPVYRRYLIAFPSASGNQNDVVWVVLWQFYPQERMEFTNRLYPTVGIRSLGRILRSQSFTWQDFGVTEQWQQVTMAWNDPLLLGVFDELVAGGYNGELWFYEDTTTDLGVAIPMLWESGVLPREIGKQTCRLLSLTVNVAPSVGSFLVVEALDGEDKTVKYQKKLSLANISKRTHILYPNRSFFAGYRVRFRNEDINSQPVISEVRTWSIEGPDFR